MGSDSDLPVMQEAAKVLEDFGVPYEISVVSAHRTPDKLVEYGMSAQKRGLKVIIAGAGGAAHLPGMTASMTTLPVIGVPVKTKTIDGLDSLLSIAQMPPGVPVATVGIDSAQNAGLLAAIIIGSHDEKIAKKVQKYKDTMKAKNIEKNSRLHKVGWSKYLKDIKK